MVKSLSRKLPCLWAVDQLLGCFKLNHLLNYLSCLLEFMEPSLKSFESLWKFNLQCKFSPTKSIKKYKFCMKQRNHVKFFWLVTEKYCIFCPLTTELWPNHCTLGSLVHRCNWPPLPAPISAWVHCALTGVGYTYIALQDSGPSSHHTDSLLQHPTEHSCMVSRLTPTGLSHEEARLGQLGWPTKVCSGKNSFHIYKHCCTFIGKCWIH